MPITALKTLALAAGVSLIALTASAQSMTIKLATDSGAKGSPTGDAMEKWASLIEEGTKGDIRVNIFYQNELGGQQEIFDLFVANDVQLMINWPSTSYDERIGLLYTPYMLKSWDDAFKAYGQGGWLNGILDEVYSDIGLKFFGAWPEGFNGVATKGKYAKSLEEAASLKVRVPTMFPMAESLQAMGYQTASIDWSETFTSIQTGVVDGDAANVIYWDYEYFRDTINYYNRTRQQFITGVISANGEFWAGLSDEQKKVVADAAQVVMQDGFDAARTIDAGYVDKAKEAGIEYIEPSDSDLAPIARKVRDEVWPQMDKRIGQEIMDKVRANAAEF